MADVSYSTMGFEDRGFEAALDAIASAGFTCIELSVIPHAVGPPVGRAATDIRRQIERRGLRATTVHAPLGDNVLGPPDVHRRREKAELLANYIRFTGEIGITGIVIHPVQYPDIMPDDDIIASLRRMEEAAKHSLDELSPVAGKADTRILVENKPYEHARGVCDYPLCSMSQMRLLIDGYPPDNVGLAVDTGHAAMAGLDPAVEIKLAGERLWGTHLQDVDTEKLPPYDNHWVPAMGGIDWAAIRSALERVSYSGAWTFEVFRGRDGQSLEQLAIQSRAIASEWGL